MRSKVKMPNEIPHHVVKNCLAYKNKNKGFYANHHLGGISWFNNTGYQNPSNFCMLNRKSAGEIVDMIILFGIICHISRGLQENILSM